jgi:hypothetical protein
MKKGHQSRMVKSRKWVARRLCIFFTIVHRMVHPTEYIFYCKRAILFLSSSKILTPHPPLRPASVYEYSPPLLRGRTDSPGGEGDGGSNFSKTREIGLLSYSKICTLWFILSDYFSTNLTQCRLFGLIHTVVSIQYEP